MQPSIIDVLYQDRVLNKTVLLMMFESSFSFKYITFDEGYFSESLRKEGHLGN